MGKSGRNMDLWSEVPAESSFSDLLEQARNGSDPTLAQLLEQNRDWLTRLVEPRITADIQAKIGASDIVQLSLLEAREDFADFRGVSPAEFRSWLKVILLNNLKNEYRALRGTLKRDIYREQQELNSQAVVSRDARQEPTPSSIVSHREQLTLLERALEGLSEEHRQVILLRHREHCDYAEIGRRMNRTEDAARMLWYRAFEKLARSLDGMK